eukprot:302785-Amphidinium_carterae.1
MKPTPHMRRAAALKNSVRAEMFCTSGHNSHIVNKLTSKVHQHVVSMHSVIISVPIAMILVPIKCRAPLCVQLSCRRGAVMLVKHLLSDAISLALSPEAGFGMENCIAAGGMKSLTARETQEYMNKEL